MFRVAHHSAATSSRSVAHCAISGVGGCAPTLRLRCRLGVFHWSVAPPRSPLRAPLLHRLAGCSSTSSRLSPCPGPAASRRCGSPFFLKYVLCSTSFPTSSLAAGWVSSRGDTWSLQCTHFVPRPTSSSSSSSGLPGGIQAAVTGNEVVSSNKAYPFLIVEGKSS